MAEIRGALSRLAEVSEDGGKAINDESSELLRVLNRLVTAQEALAMELAAVKGDLKAVRATSEVIRKSTTAPLLDEIYAYFATRQLTIEDTMLRLTQSETSVARYGDGEMKLMLKPEFRLAFQPNSVQLMRDLRETITQPTEDLLVCMPQFHGDQHWAGIWSETWSQLKPLLDHRSVFGNSHVTRPVVFRVLGDTAVDMWRSVWQGRDVRIITGQGSRFEVIPQLFDSARSVDRFDSLPVGAYEDSARILDEGTLGSPDLFVLALGPAGTTLARELAKRGRRALDVGHLSASYMNHFHDGAWPEHIPVDRRTAVKTS